MGIGFGAHRDGRPIVEVDETFVSVVGSEIKVIQEVGAQYRLTDVGDDKSEVECSIRDANLSFSETVTGDVGAVGRL